MRLCERTDGGISAPARRSNQSEDFAAGQVVITSLDLLQMLLFAGFHAIAIWQRHRIDYHKRLMLLTIACMLPDALARLPVSFMTNQLILVGMDGFIIICVGIDRLWHRRLHPAFAWGAFLFVAAFHLALYVTQTRAWLGAPNLSRSSTYSSLNPRISNNFSNRWPERPERCFWLFSKDGGLR
jgi:hypothetical protein